MDIRRDSTAFCRRARRYFTAECRTLPIYFPNLTVSGKTGKHSCLAVLFLRAARQEDMSACPFGLLSIDCCAPDMLRIGLSEGMDRKPQKDTDDFAAGFCGFLRFMGAFQACGPIPERRCRQTCMTALWITGIPAVTAPACKKKKMAPGSMQRR